MKGKKLPACRKSETAKNTQGNVFPSATVIIGVKKYILKNDKLIHFFHENVIIGSNILVIFPQKHI